LTGGQKRLFSDRGQKTLHATVSDGMMKKSSFKPDVLKLQMLVQESGLVRRFREVMVIFVAQKFHSGKMLSYLRT
jgi:hypothetical protein